MARKKLPSKDFADELGDFDNQNIPPKKEPELVTQPKKKIVLPKSTKTRFNMMLPKTSMMIQQAEKFAKDNNVSTNYIFDAWIKKTRAAVLESFNKKTCLAITADEMSNVVSWSDNSISIVILLSSEQIVRLRTKIIDPLNAIENTKFVRALTIRVSKVIWSSLMPS